MPRLIFAVLAGLLLSGCAGIKKVPLTGLNHASSWSDQIRDTANRSFEYAQLSYNSYAVATKFELDDTIEEIERRENDSISFAYAVFKRMSDGGAVELIIAYRGTDATQDLWTGSITNAQGSSALAVFDRVRGEHPDAVITVTGHSQGGALATHVTLNRENVTGYFFNTSPRFRRLGGKIQNDRYSIVEHGEPNKLLRILSREPTQLYTSIGCTRGGPGAQHSSRNLAICLTKIASWERESARASLTRNGIAFPWREQSP